MSGFVPLPSFYPSTLNGYVPKKDSVWERIAAQAIGSAVGSAVDNFVDNKMMTAEEKALRQAEIDIRKAQIDAYTGNMQLNRDEFDLRRPGIEAENEVLVADANARKQQRVNETLDTAAAGGMEPQGGEASFPTSNVAPRTFEGVAQKQSEETGKEVTDPEVLAFTKERMAKLNEIVDRHEDTRENDPEPIVTGLQEAAKVMSPQQTAMNIGQSLNSETVDEGVTAAQKSMLELILGGNVPTWMR